ncbi:MAG: pilus (MSHA type) biogenesis protein MshL, partial [Burkholderiales bacterium]|nr:pilus (MSHA type) biogenesis protein MshL [Burkholderiales bacterium]
ALARDAKLNLDVHPLISGTVTLNALNQTLPQILDRVSNQIDMRYTLTNGVLTVVPDRPYIKTYKVDYVNMSRSTTSAFNIATSVGKTNGPIGTTGDNDSSTKVTDTSDNKFWEHLTQNVKDIIAATRRVSAEEKQAREALEQKDEERRNTEVAEQKADEERKQKEERLKAAQSLAGAGAGAPQLLSMVLGNGAAAGKGGAAGATGTQAQDQTDVIANPETGVLTVNATSREHAKIQEYLDRVLAGARREVLIEATIAEVTLNDEYQTGVDWSIFKKNADGTSGDNRINYTQETIGNTTFAQLPYTLLTYTKAASGLFGGASISASVKALEQFGKTKILSSPKLMALNNQTALLKVVDETVYFTLQVNIQAATTTTAQVNTYSSTLNTVPVGVVMSVTPQIADDNTISLNVRPTISRITGYVPDPAVAIVQALNPSAQSVQSLVPQIQVREMESTLKLADGQTAILGGLIQDQIKNNRTGVPILSRLPWGIGDAFATRDDVSTKTEVVIFLRPVIINEASLDGDMKQYRQYLPDDKYFQHSEDEISAARTGLPVK